MSASVPSTESGTRAGIVAPVAATGAAGDEPDRARRRAHARRRRRPTLRSAPRFRPCSSPTCPCARRPSAADATRAPSRLRSRRTCGARGRRRRRPRAGRETCGASAPPAGSVTARRRRRVEHGVVLDAAPAPREAVGYGGGELRRRRSRRLCRASARERRVPCSRTKTVPRDVAARSGSRLRRPRNGRRTRGRSARPEPSGAEGDVWRRRRPAVRRARCRRRRSTSAIARRRRRRRRRRPERRRERAPANMRLSLSHVALLCWLFGQQ